MEQIVDGQRRTSALSGDICIMGRGWIWRKYSCYLLCCLDHLMRTSRLLVVERNRPYGETVRKCETGKGVCSFVADESVGNK